MTDAQGVARRIFPPASTVTANRMHRHGADETTVRYLVCVGKKGGRTHAAIRPAERFCLALWLCAPYCSSGETSWERSFTGIKNWNAWLEQNTPMRHVLYAPFHLPLRLHSIGVERACVCVLRMREGGTGCRKGARKTPPGELHRAMMMVIMMALLAEKCIVSTPTGIISHFVNLQVVVPEAFILGSGELHVDMGSTINLVCIIEKSPQPPQYVYWQRNDRMINYDDSRRDITIETTPGPRTQSRLIIREPQINDSGNYTCSASNTEPASIYVFVSKGFGVHISLASFNGGAGLIKAISLTEAPLDGGA
uniref:Ig-like domain-containing protein n=1 Tax=Anopheles atroparvus TaxID=41427 RepID=A0A182JB37_ANOAO